MGSLHATEGSISAGWKATMLTVFVLYTAIHVITMSETKDSDGNTNFNVPVSWCQLQPIVQATPRRVKPNHFPIDAADVDGWTMQVAQRYCVWSQCYWREHIKPLPLQPPSFPPNPPVLPLFQAVVALAETYKVTVSSLGMYREGMWLGAYVLPHRLRWCACNLQAIATCSRQLQDSVHVTIILNRHFLSVSLHCRAMI